MRKILLSLFIAVSILALPLATCAKDYYVHIGKNLNVVLTQQPCRMSKLMGPGWKYSESQVTLKGQITPTDPGCWKRVGNRVYVFPEATPFWIAPDSTGGAQYYRLDTRACGIHVPGVSFLGWRSGRSVGVMHLPKSGTGNAFIVDDGPMCWRYNAGWFERIGVPNVYSAFSVKATLLP